ncbi:MAG: hypothetical protein GC147_10705 [Porphyrobacter sp.]|nr:hypothetical protein [Porphyrobacter sp.]
MPDDAEVLARDPVLARALHDPLMSDPDLALRNQANALLGFAGEAALPVFPATPEEAEAAREAGRLELLEGGAILPLPAIVAGQGPLPPPGADAAALVAALGAPQRCATLIDEGFGWAADLPPAAAIMPHGMVVQAGGARRAPCDVRIVRYRTAAAPEDVLQYHATRAGRAGLLPSRFAEGIAASGADGRLLVVAARRGPSGLTAVDLLYRAS